MKKNILMIVIILMAMSFLTAQERYNADIGYYNESLTLYYTQLPRTITAGTYTVVGTRFDPLYPVSLLQGINIRISSMVAGAPNNVVVEIYAVNPVTNLPTGFALASVTRPYSAIITNNWNFFDFSSFNLSFDAGESFFAAQTLSNGLPGSIWYGPNLNLAAEPSHSYRYFTSGTTTGWVNYGAEWYMSANVEYDTPFHDVTAQSLWFTGDLLLPINTSIEYAADIKNTGEQAETNIPVTIIIDDIAYPTRNTVFTETVIVPYLAVGDSIHIDTFAAYTYNTPGEYIVTLHAGLATDMLPSNDDITLEQQVVVLPATLTYDDGTPDGAWAPTNSGSYFLNEFECPVGPVLITDLHYNIWPNTWPTPGSTVMGISVFDDNGFDADGNPGAPGTEVYYAQVDCVRGAWNTYNIADQLVIFSSGKFFVGYKSLDAYPNCPGVSVDNSGPHSAWKVSWESSAGLWYQAYPEYEMDWMIRASVAYVEFWPPQNLTITQSGADILLDWMDVPEASYYHVYHGATPSTITTQLNGDIGSSNYTHINGALHGMDFYMVKAAIDTGGKSYNTNTAITRATANKGMSGSQAAFLLAD